MIMSTFSGDQLGGPFAVEFRFTLGCPIDKCNVLTFDVAEFAQTLAERLRAAFYIETGSDGEMSPCGGIFAGSELEPQPRILRRLFRL